MKQRLVSFLFCVSIFFCFPGYAKNAQSLDQIVAIVNDDVVTKSEFNHALFLAKMQLAQANLPTPTDKMLHKQVLDQLVNKKLQLQIAKQAGVHITDSDLNKAIERIASQNNMTVRTLYQHIAQEGMRPADYRDEIRDQMTLQKIQQQEVSRHVSIAPQEIATFMRSISQQNHQKNQPKEYLLEDILIPISDAPSSQEVAAAKQRAQSVLDKLHQGQSLSAIVQAEANQTFPLETNALGWRTLSEIPSAFAEYINKMRVKELVGPIQTPNGFHLIRLANVHVLEANAPPDRKQIEELLLQRKFQEAMQNWVSKLRGQAFIQITSEKT